MTNNQPHDLLSCIYQLTYSLGKKVFLATKNQANHMFSQKSNNITTPNSFFFSLKTGTQKFCRNLIYNVLSSNRRKVICHNFMILLITIKIYHMILTSSLKFGMTYQLAKKKNVSRFWKQLPKDESIFNRLN